MKGSHANPTSAATESRRSTRLMVEDVLKHANLCDRIVDWGIDALLLPLPQMRVNPIGAGMTLASSAIRWAAWDQTLTVEQVALDVVEERVDQEKAWPLPDGFRPEDRLAILVEEVGEVAKACLEGVNLYEELVQVVAVCVRWMELAWAESMNPEVEATDAR